MMASSLKRRVDRCGVFPVSKADILTIISSEEKEEERKQNGLNIEQNQSFENNGTTMSTVKTRSKEPAALPAGQPARQQAR